jgi:hypothetical protein
MKVTHLGGQTATVLALVALVSWPHYRPVRAQSLWRYTPEVSQPERSDSPTRNGGDPVDSTVVERDRASDPSAPQPVTAPESPGVAEKIDKPLFVTPLSIAALGGTFNALRGIAQTSLNAPIPHARLALRSLRTGRVEAIATANGEGRFTFLDVDPDLYVVELLAGDGSVMATGQAIELERGQVKDVTVRMAAAAATVASVFGNTMTGTLVQSTDIASSSEIPRTTPALISQASPNDPSSGGIR